MNNLEGDPAPVRGPCGAFETSTEFLRVDEHASLAGAGIGGDDLVGGVSEVVAGEDQRLAVPALDGVHRVRRDTRLRAVRGPRRRLDRPHAGEGADEGHKAHEGPYRPIPDQASPRPLDRFRRIGRRGRDRPGAALEHLAEFAFVDHRCTPPSSLRSVFMPRETKERTVPGEQRRSSAVWPADRSS